MSCNCQRKVGYNTNPGQIIDGTVISALGGNGRDTNDHARLRQGRDRNLGFLIGNYLQAPPILFTRDGHAIYLADMYRGRTAFFIGAGPSFSQIDKTKLSLPGILTFGINNTAKSFRPNLWTCVDEPGHFIKSIWLDPTITKLVPFCHAEKTIFDNEKWTETNIKVGDCPNVLFYRRNEVFNAEQFLFEDTINWGNHSELGGGRSVLLVALRLMFFLGVRTVFLLGVDFEMSPDKKYHFAQDRTQQSINNNNETFRLLIERFTLLKSIFEKYNFNVFNCNKESKLTVFPFIDFEEAVKIATQEMPLDIANERTEGLYDRKASEKDDKKKKVKEILDNKRKILDECKSQLQQYIDNGNNDDKILIDLRSKVDVARKEFREIEKLKNKLWSILDKK